MPDERAWPSAPPEIVERFRDAVDGVEGLEVRKMFGYPAAFSAGRLVAGVYRDSIMLRLAEPERLAQLAEGWTPFEPMPGRAMGGYLTAPPRVIDDADVLRGWVERAAAHVRTLPPKGPRKKR